LPSDGCDDEIAGTAVLIELNGSLGFAGVAMARGNERN